jgi:hypothetical protein
VENAVGMMAGMRSWAARLNGRLFFDRHSFKELAL